MNKYYESNVYNNYFKIIPNDNVPSGKVIVSNDLNGYCDKDNCLNKSLKIEVDNLYYQDSLNLTISGIYNKSNMKKLLGIDDYETTE